MRCSAPNGSSLTPSEHGTASLLREGLVDIVDVITIQGLVGGAGAPTMMDGPELDHSEGPIRLQLIDVAIHEGAVRSRYLVHDRPTS